MMEKIITEILNLLGANAADWVIVMMGFMVVFALIWAIKRIAMLEQKYHAIDKSTVRLWDRVDPNMVSDHHSGDYSIKVRRPSE